jgi:hypothetical protein
VPKTARIVAIWFGGLIPDKSRPFILTFYQNYGKYYAVLLISDFTGENAN